MRTTKGTLLGGTAGILTLVGLLIPGVRATLGGLLGLGQAAAETQEHWCPMDPDVRRPGPGTCPICSMALVPFQGGEARDEGVLQLSDRQVQQTGVRLGEVIVQGLVREVAATGRITVDPRRRAPITVRAPGRSRIERMHVFSAGDRIAEGGVVAEIYSPTLSSLMEEYRRAISQYATLKQNGPESAANAALTTMNSLKNRFEIYGLPPAQATILAKKKKNQYSEVFFPVTSPIEGILLEEPGYREGEYVNEGGVLAEIGDPNGLWLYLDVYEDELSLIEPGQVVEYWSKAAPAETFKARIDFVEPLIQERTWTARARCRITSADGRLVPGMFVRTRIQSYVGGAISVPESAVLQSGLRDVVFVREGRGRFEPRIVRIGRRYLSPLENPMLETGFLERAERFHEVLDGLKPGEKVVVAGNFLLNAEAQFQGILKKATTPEETQAGPPLSPQIAARFDSLLGHYDALRRRLTLDEPDELANLGRTIATEAQDVFTEKGLGPSLGASIGRLRDAGNALAELSVQSEEDWTLARTHFGSISREIVGYLRDYAPEKVDGQELFVFRCPMADDFGFDLWIQTKSELENPYMGQSMLQCGRAAEL